MLEQHNDTQDEDKLKIKKQMAQFMANAVAQVTACCFCNCFIKFYNKTCYVLFHYIVNFACQF